MNRTCLNLDSFPNKGFIRGIPNHHGFQSQVTLIHDLDGYLHDSGSRVFTFTALRRLLEKRMVLLRFGQGLLRLVLLLMWTIRLTGKRFGSTSLEPWTLLILKIPERYPVRASSLQCFRKYNETWRCIAIYLRRMILQNCYMFFLLVAILWNQRKLRYV